MSKSKKEVVAITPVVEKVVAETKEVEVIVTSLTSPSRIKAVADEKGLNPQEVFVRITFKLEGDANEYKASNKLRYLGEKGYKQLMDAKSSGAKTKITVNNKGFFYTYEDTPVASLFTTPVVRKDVRKDTSVLF